jgi:hypothetical protein
MAVLQGILVDPHQRSVSLVEVNPTSSLEDARRLVGAEWLDVVQADDYFGGAGGAFFYLDDNGLSVKGTAFTLINNTPIAGKFLILREAQNIDLDDDDNDDHLASVDFAVDDVREKIRFISRDIAMDIIERGTLSAAAAYVSQDLHVERHGNTLFVTTKEDPQ